MFWLIDYNLVNLKYIIVRITIETSLYLSYQVIANSLDPLCPLVQYSIIHRHTTVRTFSVTVSRKNTQIGSFNKTNRFVYYRPPVREWAVSVSIHKSAKLDLLAVTDTPRNRELSVSTDLCLKKYTQ